MTIYPMSGPLPKREGHVIVENHDTGNYEDFENAAEYVAHYVEKMKAAGASHQAISGFRRRKR